MRSLTLTFLVTSACTGASKDDPVDTGGAVDTAETTDTADTADSGETGDTAENLDLTCSTEACGGDPVGEWTITETCFSGEWFDVEDCPGWQGRLTDVQVTGGLLVQDDGRYTADLATMDWNFEVVVPAACLAERTCADVEADTDGATCVDDGAGGCACAGSQSFPGLSADGDWTAAGVALTLDPDFGDAATSDYCADPDELRLDLNENFFFPIQLLYARN